MNLLYEPRASTILYNILSAPPPFCISDKSKTAAGKLRPFLLPANIHPMVPLVLYKAGVSFEFLDLSAITLHIDLELAFERLQTGQYGGVIYSHTYGETSTPAGFFSAAKALDPSLLLVDDRCLCPPDAQPDLEMAADVTLYSTGPGKIVDLDFGGYAFVQDSVIYQQSQLDFQPEALEKLEADYQAAMLGRQPYVYNDSAWLQTERPMPQWKDYFRAMADVHLLTMRQRMALNAIYAAGLPGEIQFAENYQLWRFNLQVDGRQQRILDALLQEGIPATTNHPSLAGVMAPGVAPVAEKLAGTVINLYNNHHLTPELAEKACGIICQNL